MRRTHTYFQISIMVFKNSTISLKIPWVSHDIKWKIRIPWFFQAKVIFHDFSRSVWTLTQWCRWGSNPWPLSLESCTSPLSHCTPYKVPWSRSNTMPPVRLGPVTPQYHVKYFITEPLHYPDYYTSHVGQSCLKVIFHAIRNGSYGKNLLPLLREVPIMKRDAIEKNHWLIQ